MFHAHRLQDLLLLGWQQSPKQPTDSMQSLSKPQLAPKIHVETQRTKQS